MPNIPNMKISRNFKKLSIDYSEKNIEDIFTDYYDLLEKAAEGKMQLVVGENEPLIVYLARKNKHEILEQMKNCFEKLADSTINAIDRSGKTALWWAIRYKYLGIIDCLLDMGADIYKKCTEDDSILQEIVSSEVLKEVFEKHGYIFSPNGEILKVKVSTPAVGSSFFSPPPFPTEKKNTEGKNSPSASESKNLFYFS